MPDKVRIVSKKSTAYDAYIHDLVSARGFGKERTYAGIASADEANEVRKRLREAGRHLGVSVKAFWQACADPRSCPAGRECRFHVRYTAYRRDDARAYKERVAERSRR